MLTLCTSDRLGCKNKILSSEVKTLDSVNFASTPTKVSHVKNEVNISHLTCFQRESLRIAFRRGLPYCEPRYSEAPNPMTALSMFILSQQLSQKDQFLEQ